MPEVRVEERIEAPLALVWDVINDIEAYPSFMDNVQSVEILRHDERERISAWSVVLKGSILEWTELETRDPTSHRISFRQLDGDLDHFDGFYEVKQIDERICMATCEVSFDIGIPLLADMLNPVACRALEESSQRVLQHIRQRTDARMAPRQG